MKHPFPEPDQGDKDDYSDPGDRDIEQIEAENELPPLEMFNKRLFFAGIGVFAVIIAISGSLFYFWTMDKKSVAGPPLQVSPTPKIVPSETPKPVLNRAEISVEVQNGSGKPGAAKSASEKLKSLGYNVVKTGNAAKSDYKNTEISLSPDVASVSGLLLTDIKSQFPASTVAGDLSTSDVKVRLIVGKE